MGEALALVALVVLIPIVWVLLLIDAPDWLIITTIVGGPLGMSIVGEVVVGRRREPGR